MNRLRIVALAILSSMMLVLLSALATPPAQAATGDLCFKETRQCISGRFREYWERNGGLAVFGYPTGPAQPEHNQDTGQTYLTQWFERNRFELHPQNKAPYDVLLGRLGDDWLRQRGIDWRQDPRTTAKAGCLYFETTGHNVCDQARDYGFKTYWQTHGLEFDGRRGVSHGESLALFGLPLTEPRMETNTSGDRVLTQWFERARFEWHPDQPNPSYRVLLGLLGNELRGPNTPLNLPTNVPWVRTGKQIVALADRIPTITIPYFSGDAQPNAVRIAPNGKLMAFTDYIDASSQQLTIANLETGERSFYTINGGDAILGGAWSPDSTRYVFSVVFSRNQFHYEYRQLFVTTGDVFVQRSEPTNLVLTPIAWNNDGIFATNILWASDAPPQGLFRLEPSSGNAQTILEHTNLDTALTSDGQKVAYVTGTRPMAQTPTSALSVLDRASGRTTSLVSERQGIIGQLDWSPNGTKLVHVRTPDYGIDPASIHVTNPDGSGEQILRLEGGAFPGRLQDVMWRTNTTLLLLTVDGPNQLSVFELSLNNFHPAAAKKLQTFYKDGNWFDEFVYLPR